jgi:basic membrane protein A
MHQTAKEIKRVSTRRYLHLSRRQVIRGLLATSTFGLTAKFGTGCSSLSGNKAKLGKDGKPIILGFIYVNSRDDYGYSQAHAEGKAGVAKLSGVKTVDQANIPETTEVQEAMRNMIEQDRANVIFPTALGYLEPHIVEVAKEYPEVQFFHCGGVYDQYKHPENVGCYFGYIDEAQYIAGIIAAKTSKTGRLGFIAAKPIPQILRNINSFTLGARSVKPDITTQVTFTGDWFLPAKEAEVTHTMIDQKNDVIACHVNSPKVIIETAEKRGIFCTGIHANQGSLAPKGYLTGVQWNWAKVYSQYAEMIMDGKTLMNGGISHMISGGLKEEFWQLSPYGSAVKEDAKKAADQVMTQLKSGNLIVYKGGLKDNNGKVVIPAGKDLKPQDSELEKMNWLTEGVIGKIKG